MKKSVKEGKKSLSKKIETISNDINSLLFKNKEILGQYNDSLTSLQLHKNLITTIIKEIVVTETKKGNNDKFAEMLSELLISKSENDSSHELTSILFAERKENTKKLFKLQTTINLIENNEKSELSKCKEQLSLLDFEIEERKNEYDKRLKDHEKLIEKGGVYGNENYVTFPHKHNLEIYTEKILSIDIMNKLDEMINIENKTFEKKQKSIEILRSKIIEFKKSSKSDEKSSYIIKSVDENNIDKYGFENEKNDCIANSNDFNTKTDENNKNKNYENQKNSVTKINKLNFGNINISKNETIADNTKFNIKVTNNVHDKKENNEYNKYDNINKSIEVDKNNENDDEDSVILDVDLDNSIDSQYINFPDKIHMEKNIFNSNYNTINKSNFETINNNTLSNYNNECLTNIPKQDIKPFLPINNKFSTQLNNYNTEFNENNEVDVPKLNFGSILNNYKNDKTVIIKEKKISNKKATTINKEDKALLKMINKDKTISDIPNLEKKLLEQEDIISELKSRLTSEKNMFKNNLKKNKLYEESLMSADKNIENIENEIKTLLKKIEEKSSNNNSGKIAEITTNIKNLSDTENKVDLDNNDYFEQNKNEKNEDLNIEKANRNSLSDLNEANLDSNYILDNNNVHVTNNANINYMQNFKIDLNSIQNHNNKKPKIIDRYSDKEKSNFNPSFDLNKKTQSNKIKPSNYNEISLEEDIIHDNYENKINDVNDIVNQIEPNLSEIYNKAGVDIYSESIENDKAMNNANI